MCINQPLALMSPYFTVPRGNKHAGLTSAVRTVILAFSIIKPSAELAADSPAGAHQGRLVTVPPGGPGGEMGGEY